MLHEAAIDRVILPVADLQAGVQPFARLGWRGIRPPDFSGEPATSRCFFFGENQRLFHLEVAVPAPAHPLVGVVQRAIQEGRGLCAVVLRVRDLDSLVGELANRGVPHTPLANSVGATGAKLVRLLVDDLAGVPLVLSETSATAGVRTAAVEAEDGLNHAWPVRRIDHLAAVSFQLEEQTHFWTHFLGVPLFGEVVTPLMVIRQFKLGDAIIELLGPASPDSPIHKRSPGLISMMSLEVADLNAAVAQAVSAGFPISEPAKGALPGTTTATVPAVETGGLAVQFLQYV